MKQPFESRLVTDQNAVRFLANPDHHRYLECFMGGQSTVKQAADRLALPLGQVWRKVQHMLKFGLIEQARITHRTGRPIRHYRAVSDCFFVPFSERSLEEILLESHLKFEQRFVAAVGAQWLGYAANNQGWGTTYSRTPNGRLVIRAPEQAQPKTLFPQPPNVFSRQVEWKLSPEDATALLHDLTALVERYAARNNHGSRSFLVRVAMSPTQANT